VKLRKTLSEMVASMQVRPFRCSLEGPGNPSTRLAPLVPFSGYVRWEQGLRVDPEKFELCFLVNERRDARSDLSGFRVTNDSSPVFIKSLSIERSAINELQVSGVLDCEALIPPEPPGRDFLLQLVVQSSEVEAHSNPVRINFRPREEWDVARGGFLYPTGNGSHYGRYLVVQGWALKKSSKLKSAEIFIDEESLGGANLDIWNPYVRAALPDPVNSERPVFSLTLDRKQLKRALGDLRLSFPFCLSARCEFEDGEEYGYSLPLVRWFEPLHDDRLDAAIESCQLRNNGLIEVSGWLSSPRRNDLEIFLDGAYRSVRVYPSAEVEVTWQARPEIDRSHLLNASEEASGFRFAVHPLALGRVSGVPRLRIEDLRTGETQLATNSSVMSAFSKESAAHVRPSSLVSGIAAHLISLPSRAGIYRPGYRLPNIKHEKPTLPETIVFASHNLSETEGAPKVLYKVAERTLGEVKRVVVVSATDGPMRSQLKAKGMRVEVIPQLSMVGQTWERYHQGRREFEELVSVQPSPLIYANVIDSVWAIDAARRLDLPSLWAIHESKSPFETYPELDPRLLIQLFHHLETATEMLFVADSTKRVFEPFRNGAMKVIPNAIDLRAIDEQRKRITREDAREALGLEASELMITVVGTTTHRKGQDLFLCEMASLQEKCEGRALRFFIVGARRGEYLDSLRKFVSEHALEENVTFVEETPDVAQYYIASDVMVVCSRVESAPLVSLEAMAFEKPLVSSTVFGLAEQVVDGENALAFDIESAGSLCEKVRRLVVDEPLRKTLAENARAFVETNYSMQRNLRSYMAAIEAAWQKH